MFGNAQEDPYLGSNAAQLPPKVVPESESSFHTPSPRVKPSGMFTPSPPVARAAF